MKKYIGTKVIKAEPMTVTEAQVLGVENKPKEVSPIWASVKDKLPPVGEGAVVLTTEGGICFGHIVDKKIAKDYNGWNIPNVEYWLPFVDPKDK